VKKLTSVFLLVLASCTAAPIRQEGSPDAHAVRLEITLGFVCGATAIAPNAVVTAAHCVKDPGLSAGGLEVLRAHYPFGKDRDVAILWVNGILPAAPATAAAPIGDDFVMAGWGCDKRHVKLDRRNLRLRRGNQVAGRICYGDSGSGVYDMAGNFVAVVSSLYVDSDKYAGGVIEWIQ